jgi:hypothetical protein
MKQEGGIAVCNFSAISAIFPQFPQFSAIFPQFPQFFPQFSAIFGGLPQFLPVGIFDTAIFRRGSKSQYVV